MIDSTINKGSFKKILAIIMMIVLYAIDTYLLDSITKVEGINIGLHNIVIVFAVTMVGAGFSFFLLLIKLTLGLLLSSNLIIYPFWGGLISITAMIITKRLIKNNIGYIGIGIIGALMYNITVYIVASFALLDISIFRNIPNVLLWSLFYGALTGFGAYIVVKYKILIR